jgi:2'-5' RNA ligase
MRLFVAADLSDDARAALAAEQQRLQSALPRGGAIRWVKPEQSHLTLVFIGNVHPERVPAFVDLIGSPIAGVRFEIVLEGLGVFPPPGPPRVLWVGITGGADRVIALQREIADRSRKLGVVVEDRPFRPHLTLARWRESRNADRARALAAARPGRIGASTIGGATLYESRLSPAGSTYIPLARATLTGTP